LAKIGLREGNGSDLRPLFKEAADLLIRVDSVSGRSSLPLVWSISRTATEWAGSLLDHPDPRVPNSALMLAQRFTTHLRRSGDERQDVMIQRGQIYLYQSRLACRLNDRSNAIRPCNLAMAILRPRQLSDPDNDSLALLTAETLHLGRGFAGQPESKWTDECAHHLDSILARLAKEADQLTPCQQRTLVLLNPQTQTTKP
jgi:hypothetical protein